MTRQQSPSERDAAFCLSSGKAKIEIILILQILPDFSTYTKARGMPFIDNLPYIFALKFMFKLL